MHSFGYQTTADQVAAVLGQNARGKTVIITGGNSGLGLETARVLAQHGAAVVLACRSEQNAAQAIDTIKSHVPNADVSSMILDLSDQSQTRSAAEEYVKSGRPLHILINNAGIMSYTGPRTLTKDGIESHIGTNHFGHFTFTKYLLPALKRSTPARIINVSSVAHYIFSPAHGISFDDLSATKSYNPFRRYGESKLANVLHAKELQRQFDAEGVDIVAVSLHPGTVPGTKMAQNLSLLAILSLLTFPRVYGAVFYEKGYKTIAQGAATTIFTALVEPSSLVKGGFYFDCQNNTKQLHECANDEALAKRLWDVSEKLTYVVN
eukprot:c3334_g1_i1.p1 GENE.c3334_g1_i1~~c3334_g1_i1.p1  ORF type:complete len:321 (-),score=37.61 c3334_g1_i1:55-1017(-)